MVYVPIVCVVCTYPINTSLRYVQDIVHIFFDLDEPFCGHAEEAAIAADVTNWPFFFFFLAFSHCVRHALPYACIIYLSFSFYKYMCLLGGVQPRTMYVYSIQYRGGIVYDVQSQIQRDSIACMRDYSAWCGATTTTHSHTLTPVSRYVFKTKILGLQGKSYLGAPYRMLLLFPFPHHHLE